MEIKCMVSGVSYYLFREKGKNNKYYARYLTLRTLITIEQLNYITINHYDIDLTIRGNNKVIDSRGNYTISKLNPDKMAVRNSLYKLFMSEFKKRKTDNSYYRTITIALDNRDNKSCIFSPGDIVRVKFNLEN